MHSGVGELYAEGGAGAGATVGRPVGRQSRVVPTGLGTVVLEPECGENAELLGSALIFMGINLGSENWELVHSPTTQTSHKSGPGVEQRNRQKMGFLPSKQPHSSGGIDCLRVP